MINVKGRWVIKYRNSVNKGGLYVSPPKAITV